MRCRVGRIEIESGAGGTGAFLISTHAELGIREIAEQNDGHWADLAGSFQCLQPLLSVAEVKLLRPQVDPGSRVIRREFDGFLEFRDCFRVLARMGKFFRRREMANRRFAGRVKQFRRRDRAGWWLRQLLSRNANQKRLIR